MREASELTTSNTLGNDKIVIVTDITRHNDGHRCKHLPRAGYSIA